MDICVCLEKNVRFTIHSTRLKLNFSGFIQNKEVTSAASRAFGKINASLNHSN